MLKCLQKTLILLLLPFSLFAQYSAETEARIRQVENSLAPRVIYGDTIPKWTLEKRMENSHAKGLTIVVIKDYKIEWAKAYGWADDTEQRKLTTSTRFQ